MQILRHENGIRPENRGGVVVIGNFDGVHRGHAAVIARGRAIARSRGIDLIVLTFEPHPRQFFAPDAPPFRLTSLRSKALLLEDEGVDILVALNFDQALASLSAGEFIDRILVRGLGAAHVVVGYDFAFGKGRAGTPETLSEHGKAAGFGVSVVAPAGDGHDVYSSTRIREHLRQGRPEEAASMLGHFWFIAGRVLHGDARGRQIGFPTANLGLGEYLRPKYGVYAIRASFEEGAWIDGVANIGIRPSFDGDVPLLEAHLFDFSGDLYDGHLTVAMTAFLRPERRFAGLDELKAQIAQDGDAARAALAAIPSWPGPIPRPLRG